MRFPVLERAMSNAAEMLSMCDSILIQRDTFQGLSRYFTPGESNLRVPAL